jgi:hypothetical protein
MKFLILFFPIFIIAKEICTQRDILEKSFKNLKNESQGHNMMMELIENIDFECIVERLKKIKFNCDPNDAEKIEISLKIGSLQFECANDVRKGQILHFDSVVEISKAYLKKDNKNAHCLKLELIENFNDTLMINDDFDYDSDNVEKCEEIIKNYSNPLKFIDKNCVINYPLKLSHQINIL